MPTLADVVREHGPAYVERYGAAMMPSHRRALWAIVSCRTGALGAHLGRCEACGREHVLYHSCRHRACPRCQGRATQRWLERQRRLLLPVRYYHVVFTLPAELREAVRRHQKALLPALFRAAAGALSALASDGKYVGGKVGVLAVLHTWSRTLSWHPHVHCLVPAVGVSGCGGIRRARYPKFLVPVKALGAGFRGRFVDLARRAVPTVDIPQAVWRKPWVVYAKPALQGAERVLRYLGRYVHRTALTDSRILALDRHTVTFRYHDHRDGRTKTMTLTGQEFLRRYLQHVSPRGLHRVRAYGLLHPSARPTLRRLQLALADNRTAPVTPATDATPPRPAAMTASSDKLRCPHCHEPALVLVARLPRVNPRAPPTLPWAELQSAS